MNSHASAELDTTELLSCKCFAFLNPKSNKLRVPFESLYFLSFVGHAFTKAVIGQSPSRVVISYSHHTPLQWAE